jgi:hypothetical protein
MRPCGLARLFIGKESLSVRKNPGQTFRLSTGRLTHEAAKKIANAVRSLILPGIVADGL